ncbi:hypothetical protein H4S00_001081 [Coemansia sp. D1744]|nr:hypothetical protein H4S00_001081 [Coemansia sp. D1744]
MPVIGMDGLNYSPNIRDAAISSNLCDMNGESIGKKERALSDHFAWLWKHMRMLSKPDVLDVKQQLPYKLADYRAKPVPGSCLQPDGLFFCQGVKPVTFATAHIILEAKWPTCENGFFEADLGKIGDYVLRIWTEQYTRSFVPVLLLHGGNVTLMVFTRQEVYVAQLGPLCVRQSRYHATNSAHIAKTLQRIWFTLTLSTSAFGNICNISNDKKCLKFVTGLDITQVERTADYSGDNVIRLVERIDRPVKIFGRASYMYKSKFGGCSAILKLTWTPTLCYPEGAGYSIIGEACLGYIPAVLLSGVLVKDLFGYRMEFLVLEDCGIQIDTYAMWCRNRITRAEQFSATLAKSIKTISGCLAKAYIAGVLHRDISAGNITINNGQVRLIDWGYSRARSDINIPNLDEIERLFAFDNNASIMEEYQSDSWTGTRLFKSVQMLMGCTERSLVHDLESLFFVGLYTLATFQGAIDPKSNDLPLGFHCLGNKETAAIQVGCLSTENCYLRNFGIRDCPDAIARVFDSMYRTLFMHNGQYIGGYMLDDCNYERIIDLDIASNFMDTQILLSDSCNNLKISSSQQLSKSVLLANIQPVSNKETSSCNKKIATRIPRISRVEFANQQRNQAALAMDKENTNAGSTQSPAKRAASTHTPGGATKNPASKRRFN